MTTAPTPRLRRRFDWSTVSDRVCSELLEAAVAAQSDGAAPVRVPEALIRTYLADVYGSQPSAARIDRWSAWDVLFTWALRDASAAQLDELVCLVQHTLSPPHSTRVLSTQRQRREFLLERNRTSTLHRNLLNVFVTAHKKPLPVRASGPKAERTDPLHYVLLEGRAETLAPLHDYQTAAVAALDGLTAGRTPGGRSGLVVLPTGAGKTRVAATWALNRMAKDKTLRVLWIAHQEELLLQAADTLQKLAAAHPEGFRRRLRVISSSNSLPTTLVDPDLDVAVVTWQSLHSNWARSYRRISAFMSRPTIVIVDEAHHAGSPAYEKILEQAAKSPRACFVGLTATPWPGSSQAAARLRRRFPTTLVDLPVEDLHTRGILATPVIHTIDTQQKISLTDTELSMSRGDLNATVLRHLENEGRDSLLVRTWSRTPERWGKTLVFATSKSHANSLGERFRAAGAATRVLHSGIYESRREILDWFRDPQLAECVLVSVGMLTEGVDLPAARTAFLARPTTSRILMRQMVGRVLRGPAAGGDATAHVVYLRDIWTNFEDLLEPGELRDVPMSATDTEEPGEPLHVLPKVRSDDGPGLVPDDVVAQLRRSYARRIDRIPLDPATSRTMLVGYYATETSNVPVMEHQQDGFDALIAKVQRDNDFRGVPLVSLFDDDYPPYPTDRQLRAVRSHIEMSGEPPTFVPLQASVRPRDVAWELRSRPLTDGEREALLRERYETTLASVAYRSFDHFEEAVERELRELRQAARGGRNRLNPENPSAPIDALRAAPTPLRRSRSRPIPDVRAVIRAACDVLAGEPVAERLLDGSYTPPAVAWTRSDVDSTWAHWSFKTSGTNRGTASIRINRRLQAPKSQVSDELLDYLLFHELLHDLMPGHGHDAEFRRLEGLWPDADKLDYELDSLHEEFSMRPKRR